MMKEQEMWKWIRKANWKKDHDYRRIEGYFKEHSSFLQRKALRDFIDDKMDELDRKFREDWLGKPGIPVSDDGWMDLRAEVIGRGKSFYNNITAKKLKKMAEDLDYTECFLYTLPPEY